MDTDKIIDNICKAAHSFVVATGETPNVVYVSSMARKYVQLAGYPYLRVCLLKPCLNIEEDLDIASRMEDLILLIKTHKNESGYDALYTVFVTKE
jgi:hypothetical protein